MKYSRTHPRGSYTAWEEQTVKDLKEGNFQEGLGNELVWENKQVRVWFIELQTGERLGFRRITNDFSFTCADESFVLNHQKEGAIFFARINKGDVCYLRGTMLKEAVWNLENVSLETLRMVILEFKDDEARGKSADPTNLLEICPRTLGENLPLEEEHLRSFIAASGRLQLLQNKQQSTRHTVFCTNILESK